MQRNFEIEQGVPEIWGFKWSEMILLREKKRGKKYHCRGPEVGNFWTYIQYTAKGTAQPKF